MIGLELDPASVERTLKGWANLDAELERKLNQLFQATALHLESSVKRSIADIDAVDTGQLRASVHNKVQKLKASVSVNAKHGTAIEYGRRPGTYPNVIWIRRWVNRKLGIKGSEGDRVAYLVSKKIHDKGTKPRPFFWSTWMDLKPQFERQLITIFHQTVKKHSAR